MMTWYHTPRILILIWAITTFPFTVWDTLYIALRPHTLPGHKWHSPIWLPVGTYAAVDGVYGEAAWLAGDGWTAAQGVINCTEVALYLWYLWIVRNYGGDGRKVGGREGGRACVIGLVAESVTLTKSSLYFMREAFSGFESVGKADWWSLLSTWGFMNVLYISASSYMIVTFAIDIIDGISLLDNTRTPGNKGKKSKRG